MLVLTPPGLRAVDPPPPDGRGPLWLRHFSCDTGSVEDVGVRQVPQYERDEEVLEAWERTTSDPEVAGVYAAKLSETGWSWQVIFSILEFVRQQPLLGELVASIEDELSAVEGVIQVAWEDQEVYVVQGAPSGADLVRAGARAVDSLGDRLRTEYDSLRADAPTSPFQFYYAFQAMRELRERSPSFQDGLAALGFKELTPEEVAERQRR